MKFLVVLSVVLCVFGLTSAGVIRSVRDVAKKGSSEEMDNDVQEALAVAAAMIPMICNRNGPGKAEIFLEGVEKFVKCLDDVYDFDDIKNKTTNGNEDDIKSALNEFCPTVPTAFACIEELSTVTNVCLLSDEIEQKDSIVRVVKNLFNYGCTDNGAKIIELLEDDNVACMNSTESAIEECMDPIINKHKPDSSEETNARDSYTVTPEDCRDFEALKTCAVSNLDTCANKAPSNFFKGMLDIITAELPCENLIS